MRQKCVVLEIPRFLVENPMIFHFSIFFRALALFSRGLFSEQYTTIWSLTKPENRLIIAGGEVWILELDVIKIHHTNLELKMEIYVPEKVKIFSAA